MKFVASILLLCLTTTAWASEARFDVGCRLTAAQRTERAWAVAQELEKLKVEAAIARQALQTLERTARLMHGAYVASDIADGVATVASIVAGVGIVRSLLSRTPLILFGHLLSTGGALTMTGTRTATVGATVYVLFKSKKMEAETIRFQLHGNEVETDTIDHALDIQFKEAQKTPLIASDMAFLTDPMCGVNHKTCAMYQPEIADMFQTLQDWHNAAEKHAKELESILPEAWTHHFGETVAQIEVPYARNMLRLVNLHAQYYQRLYGAIVLDHLACDGPSVPTPARPAPCAP